MAGYTGCPISTDIAPIDFFAVCDDDVSTKEELFVHRTSTDPQRLLRLQTAQSETGAEPLGQQ
jgi:hypothetical protein